MIYHVSLTSKCELAIAESSLWWAENRDREQALGWFDGLYQALATLRDNPERHAVIHEQSLHPWKYTYRHLLYGLGSKPTHRAVYRIHDQFDYVVTVRHLSQRDLTPDDLEQS